MTEPINHEHAEAHFLDAWRSGRMPHAWLLSGPQGLGKAWFAQRAALALLDWQRDAPIPDSLDRIGQSPAARLVASGAHPEFHVLERPPKDDQLARLKDMPRSEWPDDVERKGAIPIDQVRGLIGKLGKTASIALYRVIIIDAIDDMERSAANALLKILEEPPKDTIFLCVSHAPDRLLPTIRSRCRQLRFVPLNPHQMHEFVRTRVPDADSVTVDTLVALAEGSPGRALAQSRMDYADGLFLLREIIRTGDRDNALRLKLAKSISGKNGRDAYSAILEAAPALAAEIARTAASARAFAAIDAHAQLVQLAASGRIDPSMSTMIGIEIGTVLAALHEGAELVR